MQNEEIIEALELTGKLMELHNENPFKSKAYGAAAYKLSKLRFDFQNKTADDLKSIDGVGSGMLARIQDLMTHGSMQELDQLLDKTPQGLIAVSDHKTLIRGAANGCIGDCTALHRIQIVHSESHQCIRRRSSTPKHLCGVIAKGEGRRLSDI